MLQIRHLTIPDWRVSKKDYKIYGSYFEIFMQNYLWILGYLAPLSTPHSLNRQPGVWIFQFLLIWFKFNFDSSGHNSIQSRFSIQNDFWVKIDSWFSTLGVKFLLQSVIQDSERAEWRMYKIMEFLWHIKL